ncbi:hypothetical protein HDV00_010198 [Rhizophlyctis rosea]|nr:hypothetical protein HDV00_010198 [Rhizophlyctis rosea]
MAEENHFYSAPSQTPTTDTLQHVVDLARNQLHICTATPCVPLSFADHVLTRCEHLPIAQLADDINTSTNLLRFVVDNYIAPAEGTGDAARNVTAWKEVLVERVAKLSSDISRQKVLHGLSHASTSHEKRVEADPPAYEEPNLQPFAAHPSTPAPRTTDLPPTPHYPPNWRTTPDPTTTTSIRDLISTVMTTYSDLLSTASTPTDEDRIYISSQCIIHISHELNSLYTSLNPYHISSPSSSSSSPSSSSSSSSSPQPPPIPQPTWPHYRACLELSRPTNKNLLLKTLTELQARVLDAVEAPSLRTRRKELNATVEEIIERLDGYGRFVGDVDGRIGRLGLGDPFGRDMGRAGEVFFEIVGGEGGEGVAARKRVREF